MQDVNLFLKPYHVPGLRDAVRAYTNEVKNNADSTPSQIAVADDLMNRVDLLAHMIAAEAEAKQARTAYHFAVHKRQQGQDSAQEQPAQPSTAIITSRPI